MSNKADVILVDSGRDLLRREIAGGFEGLGLRVRRVHPAALADSSGPEYLPELLASGPGLLFSVNLQGLAAPGLARMAGESGVPVLAWFVDNPWFILSAQSDPAWKKFILAVTDHSFIAPLQLAGAAEVLHLPLAFDPEYMNENAPEAPGSANADLARAHARPLNDLVFVGRTAFPGLDSFFAGQELDEGLLRKAEAGALNGLRPDFQWWVEQTGLPARQQGFWPGKKARRPGLGAAESNRFWRESCLRAIPTGQLTVFGDEGWRKILGGGAARTAQTGGASTNHRDATHLGANERDANDRSVNDRAESGRAASAPDLRPPLDYYTRLAPIYRAAPFSLNLNSLILPAGLSQRIFDVWPAGGFCLTDFSPGLALFPAELTAPITFSRPEELVERLEFFKARPAFKRELREAWKELIKREHSYKSRLFALLEKLAGPGDSQVTH
ncbi:DUF3880 domain-containing protein [Desulfovibrio sp. OttesenSCG-928-C14]|nr:DUF3880 domain-containing protein [Desulfovibrio sp. OttesenSCG-928-C14]